MRPGSNPFHSNNLDVLVELVIRRLSCGFSKSIESCKSAAVTESNLGRVQSGAPFLFGLPSSGCNGPARWHCGLPEDPPLPARDPRIGRSIVGPIAGEDVEHAKHAEGAVEPVLAGGIGAETVGQGLLQSGVG